MKRRYLPYVLSTAFLLLAACGKSNNTFNTDGSPPDRPRNSGSCFISHNTAGCDNPACEVIVCNEVGQYCCNNQWFDSCSSGAYAHCQGLPQGPGGSCFISHDSPGCDDSDCEETVCDEVGQYCCNTQWFDSCSRGAYDLCR